MGCAFQEGDISVAAVDAFGNNAGHLAKVAALLLFAGHDQDRTLDVGQPVAQRLVLERVRHQFLMRPEVEAIVLLKHVSQGGAVGSGQAALPLEAGGHPLAGALLGGALAEAEGVLEGEVGLRALAPGVACEARGDERERLDAVRGVEGVVEGDAAAEAGADDVGGVGGEGFVDGRGVGGAGVGGDGVWGAAEAAQVVGAAAGEGGEGGGREEEGREEGGCC